MKCPKCSHDQKYREGMTCQSCNYQYIFDPKMGLRVSDNLFKVIIDRASGHQTRYFTANQLHVAFYKALQKKMVAGLFGCIGGAVLICIIAAVESLVLLPVAILVCLIVAWFPFRNYQQPLSKSREKFDEMLAQWKSVHKVDKLIEEPGLHEPPPTAEFEDLYDYGVERIVVVDREIMVDLLVRNGWHAENKALVMAESGYPHYIEERAIKLLEEREDLTVYLLHDATEEGVGMRERLKAAGRLPLTRRKIRDLGLFPADVEKMPMYRKMGARHSGYQVPLDTLGFGMLSGALGAALLGNLAFSQLVEPNSPNYGGFEADFG